MSKSRRDYRVTSSAEVYRGNAYSHWINEWLNWWFSVDPDQNNSGPVVFLKSVPSAAKLIEQNSKENSKEKSAEYGGRYLLYNRPNVMVGNDKLEIFDDQAILLPIITANWIAVEKDVTESYMRQWVRNQTNMSDNPPQNFQTTINGKLIQFEGGDDMAKHRIETPLFQVMIPDAQPGTSLKDFVEQPLPAGNYNAVVDGYFLLIADLKPQKYEIHNLTRGSPRSSGQEYYAEYLYQINVMPSSGRTRSPQSGIIPSRLMDLLEKELDEMIESNELDKENKTSLLGIAKQSREKQKEFISGN